MYTRPAEARIRAPIRVPQNYSGNAFAAPEPPQQPIPCEAAEIPQEKEAPPITSPKEAEQSSRGKGLLSALPFHLDLKRPFAGGLDFEDLLLLGLILLLLGSDGNDDILLLLIFLFFIQ